MTYEIVAFPQHGLLRTNSKGLMRQAMKEGASLVGGLDPGGVDNNIEASLYLMQILIFIYMIPVTLVYIRSRNWLL